MEDEQARCRKLTEKLAAAKSASSSAAVHLQLTSAEDAKREAEQRAEQLRQVLTRFCVSPHRCVISGQL